MGDNDKVKELKDTAIQQIMMGDVLVNYVREAGALIESNAGEGRQMMEQIDKITTMTEDLCKELAPFTSRPAIQ